MAGAPWRQRPAGLFKRKGKFFLLLLQCFFTPFAPCNVSFLILLRLKVDDSTCAPFTCSTMQGVNAPKWHAGAWHCPCMLQQLWQVAATHALLALEWSKYDPHTQHTVSLCCFNEHYFIVITMPLKTFVCCQCLHWNMTLTGLTMLVLLCVQKFKVKQ